MSAYSADPGQERAVKAREILALWPRAGCLREGWLPRVDICVYPRHANLPGECTLPLASISTWNALGENLVDFLLHRVRSEGFDDVVGNLGLHGFNDVFLLGFSSNHQKGDGGKLFA